MMKVGLEMSHARETMSEATVHIHQHLKNFVAEWRNFVGEREIVTLNYGLNTLKKLPGTVAEMTINGHSGSHGLHNDYSYSIELVM